MKNRNNNQKQNGKSFKRWVIGLGIFCAVLVAANIWTLTAYAPSKNNKNGSTDQYDLLNPARKFVDQKDLIINFQPLRDELNKIGVDGNISIYFEYLPTGANIAVNKDVEFFPASLSKVPLSLAVAKKVETGKWKWENELVIMGQDRDDKFGDLYKSPVGTKITIEELMKKMLTESDNTAYLVLLRNIEPEEFNDIKSHLGWENLFDENGKISAKKYSILLRALYASSYLKEDFSEKLLSMMTQSKFNDYIAAGIPPETIFSHKIGESSEENVIMDAGIVYLPQRPYLLTVMIHSADKEEVKKQMRNISKKVYEYIVNYKENN